MQKQISERRCTHGKGTKPFRCESLGVHYGFVCPERCGFWMNYDPFLFPEGVNFPNDFKETEKVIEAVSIGEGKSAVLRYSIWR